MYNPVERALRRAHRGAGWVHHAWGQLDESHLRESLRAGTGDAIVAGIAALSRDVLTPGPAGLGITAPLWEPCTEAFCVLVGRRQQLRLLYPTDACVFGLAIYRHGERSTWCAVREDGAISLYSPGHTPRDYARCLAALVASCSRGDEAIEKAGVDLGEYLASSDPEFAWYWKLRRNSGYILAAPSNLP